MAPISVAPQQSAQPSVKPAPWAVKKLDSSDSNENYSKPTRLRSWVDDSEEDEEEEEEEEEEEDEVDTSTSTLRKNMETGPRTFSDARYGNLLLIYI